MYPRKTCLLLQATPVLILKLDYRNNMIVPRDMDPLAGIFQEV